MISRVPAAAAAPPSKMLRVLAAPSARAGEPLAAARVSANAAAVRVRSVITRDIYPCTGERNSHIMVTLHPSFVAGTLLSLHRAVLISEPLDADNMAR